MTDERLRIPQDPDYFRAIGLATIAFARLEWDAVWCCERLEPGYINTLEERWEKGRKKSGKTAGEIAKDLQSRLDQIVDSVLRDKAKPFAVKFVDLTKERNGLMHGKPGTAQNGDINDCYGIVPNGRLRQSTLLLTAA